MEAQVDEFSSTACLHCCPRRWGGDELLAESMPRLASARWIVPWTYIRRTATGLLGLQTGLVASRRTSPRQIRGDSHVPVDRASRSWRHSSAGWPRCRCRSRRSLREGAMSSVAARWWMGAWQQKGLGLVECRRVMHVFLIRHRLEAIKVKRRAALIQGRRARLDLTLPTFPWSQFSRISQLNG